MKEKSESGTALMVHKSESKERVFKTFVQLSISQIPEATIVIDKEELEKSKDMALAEAEKVENAHPSTQPITTIPFIPFIFQFWLVLSLRRLLL
jgi:hypothetical protein